MVTRYTLNVKLHIKKFRLLNYVQKIQTEVVDAGMGSPTDLTMVQLLPIIREVQITELLIQCLLQSKQKITFKLNHLLPKVVIINDEKILLLHANKALYLHVSIRLDIKINIKITYYKYRSICNILM